MTPLSHIEVVIPARDERKDIARCVESVTTAMRHLGRERPGVTAGVTVVCDSCTDDTAAVAAAVGARSLICAFGCVGAARRKGAADAIERARNADIEDRRLWLANTDADTTVSETWLLDQVLFGDNGFDVVIGTVIPTGLSDQVDELWRTKHQLTEGHDHVHGANLGIRASTYLKAGGFAPLAVHEDRDLVGRVKMQTSRWIATHRTNVMTSGRTDSRVVGGFASYVANLAAGDTTCV